MIPVFRPEPEKPEDRKNPPQKLCGGLDPLVYAIGAGCSSLGF